MSIVLQNDAFELGVSPELGGALLFWRDAQGFNILRDTDTEPTDPRQTAGFPLIPFSNRLRDGQIVLSDRTVQIELFEDRQFALHGCGWLEAWSVVSLTRDNINLSLSKSSIWPFLFYAELIYTLIPTGLRIYLRYQNRDECIVPVGLGFHPYFAGKSEASVRLTSREAYRADPMGYPKTDGRNTQTECADLDDVFDLPYRRGVLENTLISWPARNRSVEIKGTHNLGDFILFDPEDGSFCVEPASHAINAMNLDWRIQESRGVRHLPPKQCMEVEMEFSMTEYQSAQQNAHQETFNV